VVNGKTVRAELNNTEIKRIFALKIHIRMKRAFLFCAAALALCTAVVHAQSTSTNNTHMHAVYEFVKNCGTYYLATVEQTATGVQQPHVRPFGTITVFEGKLYIQTGKKKNVSKQMLVNPHVEICAYNDKDHRWIRIEAEAIEDDRYEAKAHMLEQYPELKRMYDANDSNTQVLYLKNVTATIFSFNGEPTVIKF
jgi:uncharacterized pyridoxamine 5'-phosphate oxidase family protein